MALRWLGRASAGEMPAEAIEQGLGELVDARVARLDTEEGYREQPPEQVRAELEREVVDEMLDVLGAPPRAHERSATSEPSRPATERASTRRDDLVRCSLVYWVWMLVVGGIGLATRRAEIAELINIILGLPAMFAFPERHSDLRMFTWLFAGAFAAFAGASLGRQHHGDLGLAAMMGVLVVATFLIWLLRRRLRG